jgi:hypothetical protein
MPKTRKITPNAARFDFPFTSHCLSPNRKYLRMNQFPQDTPACGFGPPGIMVLQAFFHVFC